MRLWLNGLVQKGAALVHSRKSSHISPNGLQLGHCMAPCGKSKGGINQRVPGGSTSGFFLTWVRVVIRVMYSSHLLILVVILQVTCLGSADLWHGCHHLVGLTN